LRVWDRTAGKWSEYPQGIMGASRVVFHPTRPEFALACADSIIRVYDLATCTEIRRSPGRFPVSSIAYNPRGDRLAVASASRPSEIIDAATWETIASVPDAGAARCAAWAPDGNRVFFGNLDGRSYCWYMDSLTGHPLVNHHAGPVEDLAISPDGELLATS